MQKDRIENLLKSHPYHKWVARLNEEAEDHKKYAYYEAAGVKKLFEDLEWAAGHVREFRNENDIRNVHAYWIRGQRHMVFHPYGISYIDGTTIVHETVHALLDFRLPNISEQRQEASAYGVASYLLASAQ